VPAPGGRPVFKRGGKSKNHSRSTFLGPRGEEKKKKKKKEEKKGGADILVQKCPAFLWEKKKKKIEGRIIE